MPVNEFDQSVRPEYVSNRIELPFRELAGIAANQQKSFDEGRAIEDDLGLLGQAIKAAPMYEGHRQAFIKEYQSKIKELTGNGNINYADPEFKRKASMLVNEFKSRPEINAFTNTLKSYQDWEGQVKSPDNAMNLDFTYKKDKDGNFNQLDVNKQGVYSPTFTKFEDYNETGKKIMGNIASDGSLKDSGYDFSKPGNTRINNGETEVFNSKTHGWEGVSSGKLGMLSEMMVGQYANTVAGKHHLQSLIGENITYNQLDKETKAQVDNIFKNHLYAANASQVGGKTVDKIDYHFEKDRAAEGSNDAEAAKLKLLGTSGESPTTNMIASNPAFTSLIDKGIVSVDPKTGLVNVDLSKKDNNNVYDILDSGGRVIGTTYDYAKAEQQRKDSNGKISSIVPRKVSSKENADEIAKLAVTLMTSVGYKPKDGKLTSDDYPKIFTAYNMLSKARSGAEILSAPVQNIVTDQVMNQQDAYSVYDNDGNYKSELNINPDEKFHADKRISIGGKSYLQGFIDRPTGNKSQPYERVPITVRAESKQDNEFFDEGAKVAKDAIEFISSNKANKDAGGDDRLIVGNSNGKTKYIKKFTSGQLAGGITYEGYADSKNSSDQTYHINLPTGESLDFNDYNSFLRNLNSLYYYDTKSGQSAVEWLKTQAKQSESLTN